MLVKKGSGILLHVTSLPSCYGIGDFGPGAYRFVDFFYETKQSFWQILPLTPTEISQGNSPYNSFSAFAGNKYLISPELLFQEGLIKKEDLKKKPVFPLKEIDYLKVTRFKEILFQKAYKNFKTKKVNGIIKYEFKFKVMFCLICHYGVLACSAKYELRA